jgi:hypothetical protein
MPSRHTLDCSSPRRTQCRRGDFLFFDLSAARPFPQPPTFLVRRRSPVSDLAVRDIEAVRLQRPYLTSRRASRKPTKNQKKKKGVKLCAWAI